MWEYPYMTADIRFGQSLITLIKNQDTYAGSLMHRLTMKDLYTVYMVVEV